MKTLLTIGYETYLLPDSIQPAELTGLLKVLRGMTKVSSRSTPNYKESRLVLADKVSRIGILVEDDAEICTVEEFQKICDANPEEKEAA